MVRRAEAAVERLRPEGMRSTPLRMEPVFEDPESALAHIRQGGPYRTMVAYMGHSASDDGPAGMPWFLTKSKADVLLGAPRWAEAAREAFEAEIVRPMHVVINLNGPMPAGPPHLDQPEFRGFGIADAPLWLLTAMSKSRLFLPWLIPLASGVAWFWRGEGGEFEYWPAGPEGPSTVAARPMWNSGVMSDNEAMWHRVGGFGAEPRQRRLQQEVRAGAQLDWERGCWRITQDGGELTAFEPEEVRISLVWKALVFRDGAHLASFEDKRFDLDLERVTEIFFDDLTERGIVLSRPADPFGDPEWRAVLEETYRTPFG